MDMPVKSATSYSDQVLSALARHQGVGMGKIFREARGRDAARQPQGRVHAFPKKVLFIMNRGDDVFHGAAGGVEDYVLAFFLADQRARNR